MTAMAQCTRHDDDETNLITLCGQYPASSPRPDAACSAIGRNFRMAMIDATLPGWRRVVGEEEPADQK